MLRQSKSSCLQPRAVDLLVEEDKGAAWKELVEEEAHDGHILNPQLTTPALAPLLLNRG